MSFVEILAALVIILIGGVAAFGSAVVRDSPKPTTVYAPTPAAGPVTQAASGRTISMPAVAGAARELHLSHRWRWSEPRVSGRAVELRRIDYVADPGYDGWMIVPRHTGTATLTAKGGSGKRFRLTVHVS